MNRLGIVLAAFGALQTAACRTAEPPVISQNPLPSRPIGEVFVITGRFFYEDGDRLSWRCARSLLCVETLIRDQRFQREIDRLLGATLTLRVERVSACDAVSSGVACLQSLDGTALRIRDWVSVEPAHR